MKKKKTDVRDNGIFQIFYHHNSQYIKEEETINVINQMDNLRNEKNKINM